MKIGLLQSAPKIGAIRENAAQLLALMELDPSCDLYVSPELALLGYPPRDLLSFPEYLDLEKTVLKELTALSQTRNFSLLIGHTLPNKGVGKALFNAASLLRGGQSVKTFLKSRNPAYDIFEEERFFQSAPPGTPSLLELNGKKLGIAICEDSWDSVRAFGVRDIRRYSAESNPFRSLGRVDLLVNLSASPFSLQKKDQREALMAAHSGRHQCPLVYCNQVGAQDHLIFDGASFVVDQKSAQSFAAPIFESGLFCIDLSGEKISTKFNTLSIPSTPIFASRESLKSNLACRNSEWESLLLALCCGIKDYVHKTQQTNIILGLSGGIDSSLVATLAALALGPEHVTGVSLPSKISSQDSRQEAARVASSLGIHFKEISIEESVESFRKSLSLEEKGLPYENLQARVRAVVLMGLSNSLGPLLLATSNKSELAMGYSTFYGDLCGALLPIGDLYKTEVYGLAHYINQRARSAQQPPPIPDMSLFRAPTAELAIGQKDSDSLPPYEILDSILFEILENQGQMRGTIEPYNEILAPYSLTVEKLKQKIARQEFKRFQAAPILKVHARSFGAGWQMPIAKGY